MEDNTMKKIVELIKRFNRFMANGLNEATKAGIHWTFSIPYAPEF